MRLYITDWTIETVICVMFYRYVGSFKFGKSAGNFKIIQCEPGFSIGLAKCALIGSDQPLSDTVASNGNSMNCLSKLHLLFT